MPGLLFAAEVAMFSRSSRTCCAALAVAAATLAAAGCTTSNHATSSKSSGGSPSGPGGSTLTAAQAVQLAAQHAQRVTSFAATMAVQTSGTEAGDTSGTMEEQSPPSPVLVVNFSTFSLHVHAGPGGMPERIHRTPVSPQDAHL